MPSRNLATAVANYAATTVRREVWNGREYFVAPLTLIVPGVLSGSQGSILYTAEEVAASAADWENVPIVVRHPKRGDLYISAHEPGVLDRQGIGFVRSPRASGRLTAEAWIEVDRARLVDPRVYRAIVNGESMEVSTGLFGTYERAHGTYKSSYYETIIRNIKPDHLAILPDTHGACSLDHGCGLNTNLERTMTGNVQQWLESAPLEIRDALSGLVAQQQQQKTRLVQQIAANSAELDEAFLQTLPADKLETIARLVVGNSGPHDYSLPGFTEQAAFGALPSQWENEDLDMIPAEIDRSANALAQQIAANRNMCGCHSETTVSNATHREEATAPRGSQAWEDQDLDMVPAEIDHSPEALRRQIAANRRE